MKTPLETDAAAYVAILNNGPVNGWGQNYCPTTGRNSHVVLHDGKNQHGEAEFDAAVTAAFRDARN